jgi:hypothetical protein
VVVNKVCNEPAPDPRALNPGVPAGVAALVQALMAKERAERPQTATEVRVLISQLLSGDQQDTLVLRPTSQVAAMPATISGATVLPPGRSERALGGLAGVWRVLPLALAAALALLPLPLCPAVGLQRSGAWPWDDPGFWLLLLLTVAAWTALLWLPLRRLALTFRRDLSPLAVRERWPGVIGGAVLVGGAAALALGALCELFRWRADAWITVQGVLGAVTAIAWTWGWTRHPLAADARAHHGRHLVRLTEAVGGAGALAVLCLLLLTLRDPAPAPEAPRAEPAKSEAPKRTGGFWSQVRDTFREGRASAREAVAPRETVPTPAPSGLLLTQAPAAAGTAILAGLALAVLLPGLLTLVARRRERRVGTPGA